MSTIVGFFVLIFMTTFSIDKVLMNSRYLFAREQLYGVRTAFGYPIEHIKKAYTELEDDYFDLLDELDPLGDGKNEG